MSVWSKSCRWLPFLFIAAFLVAGYSTLQAGCEAGTPTRTLTIQCEPSGGAVLVEQDLESEQHDLPWSGEVSKFSDVSVQALPASGWSFDHWSGDVPDDQVYQNPITFQVTEDREITVHWVAEHQVTAVIDEVTPNPQNAGLAVHFSGYGECSSAHPIVEWEWKYQIDMVATSFSSESEFDFFDFTEGEYTISFRVMCSEGVWSPWVEWPDNPLVINP